MTAVNGKGVEELQKFMANHASDQPQDAIASNSIA